MFFKIMTSYIIGYVYVSIEGYYIERFINICKKNNIIIWNLRKEKNIILFFNVNIKEFKEICRIAQKVNCKVKIINKKGLPFLIHKYKKRKIFAALLLIVIFIIWLSSIPSSFKYLIYKSYNFDLPQIFCILT